MSDHSISQLKARLEAVKKEKARVDAERQALGMSPRRSSTSPSSSSQVSVTSVEPAPSAASFLVSPRTERAVSSPSNLSSTMSPRSFLSPRALSSSASASPLNSPRPQNLASLPKELRESREIIIKQKSPSVQLDLTSPRSPPVQHTPRSPVVSPKTGVLNELLKTEETYIKVKLRNTIHKQ
jgi:hypothetical protein